MRLSSKSRFYTGIAILIILIMSYFIKMSVESGSNYETQDTLLGILILHKPIFLIVYLIIAVILIITGIKKFKLI